MNETNDAASTIRRKVVTVWVLLSGALGYGCLAYAVMGQHGERIHALVNQILGVGV